MNNTTWLEGLGAGDEVILSTRVGREITEVYKVTKTMIVIKSSGYRFNRLTGRAVGDDFIYGAFIYEATPELRKKVVLEMLKKKLVARLTHFKMYTLDADQLQRIFNITQEK
jgi:hypothetical protein